jgi:hypothetical protein
MPKAHKPGPKSAFTIRTKPTKKEKARADAFWADWNENMPTTYLVVPKTVASFSKHDPRKKKWRRSLTSKS